MTAKGYGRNDSQWMFTCKSRIVYDHMMRWLSTRPKQTTQVTVLESDSVIGPGGARHLKFRFVHTAHNEHNWSQDVERRLAEHMAIRLSHLETGRRVQSRYELKAEHHSPWVPLRCETHDDHCHTSEHKTVGGRCCRVGAVLCAS